MAATTTVPAAVDEITAEWVSDALGAAVEGVDVRQIAVGEGFTSHIARVTIKGGGGRVLTTAQDLGIG